MMVNTNSDDPQPVRVHLAPPDELQGGGVAGIFFVNIDTGVTDGWVAEGSERNPHEFSVRGISSDGSRALYTCAEEIDAKLLPCRQEPGSPFIHYVLDTGSGRRERLTAFTGEFVTLSPDARIVVGETKGGLASANLADPTKIELLRLPVRTDAHVVDASWSPDAEAVVLEVQVNESGKQDIYLVRFDGTPVTKIAASGGVVRWSPDSSKFAVADNFVPITSVFDARGQILWANSEQGNGPNPRWSPDGKYLALPVSPLPAGSPARIDVLDAEFGLLAYRIQAANACEGLIWNADGSKLIFTSYGNAGTVAANRDTKLFSEIHWEYVVPSPNDPDVVIASDGHRFIRVPPTNQGSLILNTYVLPAWFPDHEPLFAGGRIVFATPHIAHGLCTLSPVDSRAPRSEPRFEFPPNPRSP